MTPSWEDCRPKVLACCCRRGGTAEIVAAAYNLDLYQRWHRGSVAKFVTKLALNHSTTSSSPRPANSTTSSSHTKNVQKNHQNRIESEIERIECVTWIWGEESDVILLNLEPKARLRDAFFIKEAWFYLSQAFVPRAVLQYSLWQRSTLYLMKVVNAWHSSRSSSRITSICKLVHLWRLEYQQVLWFWLKLWDVIDFFSWYCTCLFAADLLWL